MNQQEFSAQLLKQVESAKKYAQITARAWDDESFKENFFAEPKAVLIEYGIEVPNDLEIRVVENTANLLYVTLPIKPSAKLSEEQLEIVQQYSDQFPQQGNFDSKYYQIIAQASEDDSLKQRLLSEPKAVLTEYGIEVPNDLEICFVENTANLVYLTLTIKPSEELCDEELELVAGGLKVGTLGTIGSAGGCVGTLFCITAEF